jgi:NADH-ubiquinone oxidoreductase chain 4
LSLIFPSLTFWWFLFCVINIGAPPSINFFGEIILLGVILKISIFCVLVALPLFVLRAGYSLYLFRSTQHGKRIFNYSVDCLSLREYFLLFSHIWPLLMVVVNLNLIFK